MCVHDLENIYDVRVHTLYDTVETDSIPFAQVCGMVACDVDVCMQRVEEIDVWDGKGRGCEECNRMCEDGGVCYKRYLYWGIVWSGVKKGDFRFVTVVERYRCCMHGRMICV